MHKQLLNLQLSFDIGDISEEDFEIQEEEILLKIQALEDEARLELELAEEEARLQLELEQEQDFVIQPLFTTEIDREKDLVLLP